MSEPNPFKKLTRLIGRYASAAVAESWKGDGDPKEADILEAKLRLACAELNAELAALHRTYADKN